MKAYRVSRHKYHVGDSIWEAQIGRDALTNILMLMGYIATGNQAEVQRIINAGMESNVRGLAHTAYKEAFLEFIRQSKYKNRPTRFANMFVFRNISDAQDFKRNFRSENDHLYEIELTGREHFVGDMRVLDEAKTSDFENISTMSERYWTPVQSSNPIFEMIIRPESKPIVSKEF